MTARVRAPRVVIASMIATGLSAGACGSSQDPASGPLGCPNAPVRVTAPNSLASASVTESCDGANSVIKWSDGAAGSPCTRATECQPTCCYCTAQGRSALTSWCDHGRCAAPSDVCCAVAGTPLASCGTG